MVHNGHEKVRSVSVLSWFPLGLENLEKWESIFQSGKSQRKSGNFTQNTRKIQKIYPGKLKK